MKRKTITIITSVSLSNTLLFSLITSPLYATGITSPQELPKNIKLIQKQEESEKIVVESHEGKLIFAVGGKPGRHCVVLAKLKGGSDLTGFTTLDNTKTMIGQSGTATMTVEMKDALNKKITFSVLTADSPDFKKNPRGMKPVEILMSTRQISQIQQNKGVSSRAMCATSSRAVDSLKELTER